MSGAWRTVRIGDWGEVRGGRQRSPHLTSGQIRPYLRVANVFDGFIDTTDVLGMLFTDDEFATYELEPGDILLNEGQSSDLVGRSAIYEGPGGRFAFQNTLVRFRAGPDCDPVFAHELFRQLWHDGVFERISKKTTSIAHLGVNRFADLTVRVPSLETQQRIAVALRAFGRAERNMNALLEGKRAFKRALLHDLLTERRRFPEFASAPMPLVALGEVATPGATRNRGTLDASRVMGVLKEAGMVPMKEHVRADDLTRYQIVSPDGFAYNPMRLNIGSIARNLSGADCLVSPDYVVFTTDPSVLLPAYLDQVRRSNLWSDFVRAAGSGSVRVRIYFRDLAEIQIPLPSLDEQHRIADVLEVADREIALLETLRDSYEAQKRTLMHRLLSGDLPIPALPAAPELAHA